MIDDIRPPRPTKAKLAKKPAAAPEPKQEVDLPDLPEIMPPPPEVTIPIDEKGKSLLSKNPVKNLKNLHPKHWYNLSRTEKLLSLGSAFLILVAVWLAAYFLFIRPSPEPINNGVIKVHAQAKPVTVEAPLTGLPIDPALAKRPITGIMIENSDDARPQSGLQDAGVVYEAIAEAGITRFLGLFQDTRPAYIGPVRSLRPYYIDFFTPWDASIAHVGGSPEALSEIRSGGKDLDQFFNSGAYWRVDTRDAPHNVYTSFDKLDALNQSKGYTSSAPKSWTHKKDAPLKVPSAKTIHITVSSADFNSHYDYDAKTNAYLRSEGGKPHLVTTSAADTTGQQLHPKVVIALVLPLSSGELDASGAYYSDYTTSGSGNVYVFQDGGVVQGTWEKADRPSQFVFKDSAGNVIKLDAGQTWLVAVSGDNMVSYAP